VVAGGFIGLSALYSVIISSDPAIPFALGRALSGVAFSLGLVLVVIARAELFTGNNLLVMASADRKISTGALLHNWLIVYIGNAVGAFGLALLVYLARHGALNGGALAQQYVELVPAKTALPPRVRITAGTRRGWLMDTPASAGSA
jgi:formate transporter